MTTALSRTERAAHRPDAPRPVVREHVTARHIIPLAPTRPRRDLNPVLSPAPRAPVAKAVAASPPYKPEPYGPPYIERPEVQRFIASVAHGDSTYARSLTDAFSKVPQRMKPDPNAPKTGEDLAFDAYMAIFNSPQDIQSGVEFAQKHRATLERASRTYGVDPQAILGILLVESRYGAVPDRIPVLNALVQRGFDGERTEYFRGELVSFLEQARRNKWSFADFKGSLAGAFGMPQFMPSNVPRFAVAARPNAVPNIFDADDAILSVGNYLHSFSRDTKWQPRLPAAVELAGNVTQLTDNEKITARDLRRHRFALPGAIRDNVVGTIYRYKPAAGGPDRAMFLTPNADVIWLYNNHRTYAAATYLLGAMVYERWRHGEQRPPKLRDAL